MTHTLLVYGSLRKGANNNRLMDGADYIGTTKLPGFSLFELGGWFPGVKNTEAERPWIDEVVVDIYGDVSDEQLKRLDHYEGYYEDAPNNSLFRRIPVTTLVDEFPKTTPQVYVYNGAVDLAKVIESGDWIEFTKGRDRA